MLSPEYLETIGDGIGYLYEDVITDILVDMAERIVLAEDSMTATNEYLNQKLIDLGLQQEFINQKLGQLLDKSEKEVEKVMEESTYKSTRDSFELYRKAGYDASGIEFSRILNRSTNVLKGELTNLTRTTAKEATSTFTRMMDKAYLQVSSGAYSYTQATQNVIKELAKEGIGTIEYGSGTKRTVEAAVRCAVRTAVNQNALACEMEMLDEMGTNLVETSSHMGARPDHAKWQGKIFWKNHPEKDYDNFYDETRYGKGDGLGGWNCRHSFYPYFPEFGEQTYTPVDEEENNRMYELEQEQRKHERAMRAWDRKMQIQKAGGVDTKTAQQYYNYHKSQIKRIVDESEGRLKRDYSAEKGYTKSKIETNEQRQKLLDKASKIEYKNDSPKKADTFEFTPAKTIKEAEEYVSQFVDKNGFGALGVSYKGMSVDVANKINKAIGNFYDKFDVGKLNGVVAPTKNSKQGKMLTNAHAGFNRIRNSLLINRDNAKTEKKFLESLLEDKKMVKKYIDNPDNFDLSKMSKRVSSVLENSKKSGRGLVADTIEEAIYHELGHALEKYLSDHTDVIKESMEKNAKNVSGYATDNMDEYIAECFCSYMKGEKLIDDTMRHIFDGLRKK